MTRLNVKVAPTSVHAVLHVITEVRLDPHTSFWPWIQADPTRRHSIVFTRQYDAEAPQALRSATHDGGDLFYHDGKRGGMLARAQRLRSLTTWLCTLIRGISSRSSFAPKEQFARPVLPDKDDYVF